MISKRTLLISLGAVALVPAGCAAPRTLNVMRSPLPPRHHRDVRTIEKFGMSRTDAYAWMKPGDWHAILRDPLSLGGEIQAAVEQENAYTNAVMAPTTPLQEKLRERIKELEALGEKRVEVEDCGYAYYTRQNESGGRPVYARRPTGGGGEQILLDVEHEALGEAYTLGPGGPQHSPDQRLLGWAADETGAGAFTLRVREIETGRMLVSGIDNAHGAFAFEPQGRYFFWVHRSDEGRPDAVRRRDMRTGEDVEIYAESDPAVLFDVRVTASGGYVIFRLYDSEMSEVWFIPTADPTRAPTVIERRAAGLTYDVEHWDDRFVIITDADGAIDRKLMTASPNAPGRENWAELVPHKAGRPIRAIHPFSTHLVREEWRDAKPRLVVMEKDGGERDIVFEDPAYAIEVPARQGYENNHLTYVYQSPRTPAKVFYASLETAQSAPVDGRGRGVSGFSSDDYIVERIEAPGEGGVRVPVTVLRRKNTLSAQPQPLLLYAYGSYGVNALADFSPAAVALVDEGWTFAIAHVRGGAERGAAWWRSVLKHGKSKTFTDFIASAELLIAEGYAERGKIVAHGLSAGGLLMGAVYTMRPDLWAGVIAQAPFVDVLNTIDDYQNHPLGETPFPIWGDPRIEEDYRYMASYSPYEALVRADYPALLATGGVADDAVAFWEAMKFAAKARYLTTGDAPIMSLIHPTAGHPGPSGAEAVREQQALFLAFAISAVNDNWPG